jgi:hypothetical protein
LLPFFAMLTLFLLSFLLRAFSAVLPFTLTLSLG